MASPTNIFSPTIIFSPHLILFFSTWTFYFFLLVLFVFYAGFLPTVSYLYFYIDKGSDCLLYYLFHLSIPLTLLYYSQLHFVVNLWDTLSSWVLKGFKCKQTGNKSLKASCGLWPFLKTSTSWSRCCVGAEGFGGSRPDKPDLYWSSLRRNRRQTGRTKINKSFLSLLSFPLIGVNCTCRFSSGTEKYWQPSCTYSGKRKIIEFNLQFIQFILYPPKENMQ